MPLNVVVKIQVPVKPDAEMGTGYGEGPLLIYGPPMSQIGPMFIHREEQPKTHERILDVMEGKVRAYFPAQLMDNGMLNIVTDMGTLEDPGW